MNYYFRKIFILISLCFLAGCGSEGNSLNEPENTPPSCSIVFPAEGSSFTLSDNITITAEANDTDGEIESVTFMINGSVRSTDTDSPYSYTWDVSEEEYGNYEIIVSATDNENSITRQYLHISLSYGYNVPEETDDGWSVSTLQSENIDSTYIYEMMNDIFVNDHDYLQSILIARNGKLVFEEYKDGFDRTSLHHLQSATKSITSALVGIAIDRGFISGVNEPFMNFFPEYDQYRTPEKEAITLEHILTMTPGLEWNENSEGVSAYENDNYIGHTSASYLRYAISKPVVYPPGTIWYYNSGCSIILGGIIRNTTDLQASAFADEYLFGPLGIINYNWITMNDGLTGTGGSLWMGSRDMAKIGQLFLNGGSWNGERIISEDWVNESTKSYISMVPDTPVSLLYQYGYQWWVEQTEDYELYYAYGHAGQCIFIIEELNMVIAITANYTDSYQSDNYALAIDNQEVYIESMVRQKIIPAAIR
ncbi:MAG: serine hydrolase [bacterium]|nr:serine hydrolase [bacterium]